LLDHAPLGQFATALKNALSVEPGGIGQIAYLLGFGLVEVESLERAAVGRAAIPREIPA